MRLHRGMFRTKVRQSESARLIGRSFCRKKCKDALFISRKSIHKYLQSQHKKSPMPRKLLYGASKLKSMILHNNALPMFYSQVRQFQNRYARYRGRRQMTAPRHLIQSHPHRKKHKLNHRRKKHQQRRRHRHLQRDRPGRQKRGFCHQLDRMRRTPARRKIRLHHFPSPRHPKLHRHHRPRSQRRQNR